MRIGVIGSGAMGGSLGRLLGLAGYDVMFSGASDPTRLAALAERVGGRWGAVADAAGCGPERPGDRAYHLGCRTVGDLDAVLDLGGARARCALLARSHDEHSWSELGHGDVVSPRVRLRESWA